MTNNVKYYPLKFLALAFLFMLMYLMYKNNGKMNTNILVKHIQNQKIQYVILLAMVVALTVYPSITEFADANDRSGNEFLKTVYINVSPNPDDEHLFRRLDYNDTSEVKILYRIARQRGNESPVDLNPVNGVPFDLNEEKKEYKSGDTLDMRRVVQDKRLYQKTIRGITDMNVVAGLRLDNTIPIMEPMLDTTSDAIRYNASKGEYTLLVEVFLYKSSATNYAISPSTIVTKTIRYSTNDVVHSSPTNVPELVSPIQPQVDIQLEFDSLMTTLPIYK